MAFWKQPKIIIILILILAFLLRFIGIQNNPKSLYGDELTMVYDSYSLLKTGMDQTGQRHPLTFSMGAGRPAGYVYGEIPFVALFGPTAPGVRSLSILSGLAVIFLAYLIASQLISKQVGLISAFLLAVSPWELSLSRGGFEAHLALALALLGTWALLQVNKNQWFYLLASAAFGLTIHTYPTYKLILVPFLILLIFFAVGWKKLISHVKRPPLISAVILGIFLISLAVIQTFTGGSETRFESINLFALADLKQEIIQNIDSQRTLDEAPKFLSRLTHNQPAQYGLIFGESYIKNLSVDFLFLHGDGNPRHNPATMGGLYLVEIITIFFGLGFLWKEKKTKLMIFLIGWIFIAPLSTALLLQPHFLRSAFLLPALTIISALGTIYLWRLRNSLAVKALIFILAVGFIIQLVFLTDRLYFLSPNEFSRFWAYPAKEASLLAIENKDKFAYIILSDRIDSVEFAYPVYAKVSPANVIEQNQHKGSLSGKTAKKFGNVYVTTVASGDVEAFLKGLGGSVLYIGPESDKTAVKDYQIINGADKKPALLEKELQD